MHASIGPGQRLEASRIAWGQGHRRGHLSHNLAFPPREAAGFEAGQPTSKALRPRTRPKVALDVLRAEDHRQTDPIGGPTLGEGVDLLGMEHIEGLGRKKARHEGLDRRMRVSLFVP